MFRYLAFESGVTAASPDGLVIKTPQCVVHGDVTGCPNILEVKCPYVARYMTVAKAASKVLQFCLGE
jgi:hypothetical protein